MEQEKIKINVKMLSDQTYQFEVSTKSTVLEFKELIAKKVDVPVQKQRLVFGGKQLMDINLITQYVKQNNCTLHLIAKRTVDPPTNNSTIPSPNTTNNANSPQHNPQTNSQNNPPQNPAMSLLNMFTNIMGGGEGNTINSQPMNINIEPIMRNVAQIFNFPPMNNIPNIQVTQRRPQQSTSNTTNPPINNPTQNNQQPNVVPSPPPTNVPQSNPQPFPSLQTLSSSINGLNLPYDNSLSSTVIERQRTLAFLKRLLHEMLRFIPQLNRGIQLMGQGRVSHLGGFLRVFQNLNRANSIASQAIQHLLQNNQQAASNLPQANVRVNVVQFGSEGPQPLNQLNNLLNTFNINLSSQTQMNPQNNPPQMNPQNNTPQMNPQNNPPQMNPQNNTPQINPQNNTPQMNPQNNPPQMNPQNNTPQINPQNNTPQINPQNNPPQMNPPTQVISPPQMNPPTQNEPMQVQTQPQQGLNFGSILSLLGEQGSLQELLGSSLGESYAQMFPQDTIYQHLLTPFSAQDILSALTSRNFAFLNEKKPEIRQSLKKAFLAAGSKVNLIHRLQTDFITMISPPPTCISQIQSIFRGRIEEIFQLILQSDTPNFAEKLLSLAKLLICEQIEEVESCSAAGTAIQNIKNFLMQKAQVLYTPFLVVPFLNIVEKNLQEIYKSYKEEKLRKQQMSEVEIKNEEELLAQIQLHAQKDKDYLTGFKHSQHYIRK